MAEPQSPYRIRWIETVVIPDDAPAELPRQAVTIGVDGRGEMILGFPAPLYIVRPTTLAYLRRVMDGAAERLRNRPDHVI